jgi:hypothetical protein
MPTNVRLIFSLFQILSKMIFDYQLDCENDFLLGSGKNARTNACKDVGNSLCHNFTLKDTDDETDTPKVLPGKVSDSFLFGPACDIQTRSVIYPCNRNRCRIPCSCKSCRKRMTKTCSKSDCCCSDCSELFKEHSRYHRVWHESCKFCENILQCFPNFNFWFLNSGNKLLQVEGYHRLEHFPIKPLVDHDNLQVYSSNRTWYTTPSEYEDFIKNMSMQANYFLISCHECDHHFKSSEQFREHVNLNHLVTKRFYHNFVNSYQEETDFTCEHCAKTLRNKPELVKHIMRVHYQYHLEYECDQCGNKYSRLSELSRHKRCVHKPLPRNQCNYCGKEFHRKDYLTAHVLRVHENGQIYNCEKCNTPFNKKSSLDRHQSSSKAGNGSSKYQCNDCERSFCTGKQLQAHLNDHIGLACDHCSERFKRIDVLQRHVMNRKVMKCSYCGQDFCNEQTLRKHKYKLHLDDILHLPPE